MSAPTAFGSALTRGGDVASFPKGSLLTFELANARGSVTVRLELFDSAVLERRIWRIVDARGDSAGAHGELLGLVEAAIGADASQILRRTAAANTAEIWALEAAGFELVDVGVTFARRPSSPESLPRHPHVAVRLSTDDDLAAIVPAMVEQPWGGRYEADPSYTAAQVRELRSRWLWNSHRGRADAFLVGVVEGVAAGYATCMLDGDADRGDIELVGVLPEFRRRGVASHLVAEAVAWFTPRVDEVTVRTQAANTAAARVYENAGFRLSGSDLTFRLSRDGGQH